MKHRETHPNLDVDGCFRCRIAHFRVSASATPTRSSVGEMTRKEQILDRDLDAYKRIRRTGGQPQQIDGSAQIEATAN